MPTYQQVVDAIASRDAIAAEIRSYGGPGMDFAQCLQLCGKVLAERYRAANKVACFVEEAALESGSFYRLKDGKLMPRTRARA